MNLASKPRKDTSPLLKCLAIRGFKYEVGCNVGGGSTQKVTLCGHCGLHGQGLDWPGPVHKLVHSEIWSFGRFDCIFTNNSATYLDHTVWPFII